MLQWDANEMFCSTYVHRITMLHIKCCMMVMVVGNLIVNKAI
jgi:hypothetical protein